MGQPVLHKSIDESYSVMNRLDDVIRSLQQTPWPETSLENYSLTYPQCMGDMQTGDSVNLQSLLLQQQQEEQQQKQQELQKQESQLQLLQQQHELQIHQQKYHEQQHQIQAKQLQQIRQQQFQHDQQQIYHLQQMHHLQEHHQNYQQQHHTAQHHHKQRSQEQNNNRYQQQVYNPETGQIYFLQLQVDLLRNYLILFYSQGVPKKGNNASLSNFMYLNMLNLGPSNNFDSIKCIFSYTIWSKALLFLEMVTMAE